MRAIFIIIITLFFFLQITSCNNQTPQKRNAELVVTYDDKEVHRAGSSYKSLGEFHKILDEPGKKYIIFTARWCPACKFLQKALSQSGHTDKVVLLDVDEPWVAQLSSILRIKNLPTMIISDEKGNVIGGQVGTPGIVTYLVINVE